MNDETDHRPSVTERYAKAKAEGRDVHEPAFIDPRGWENWTDSEWEAVLRSIVGDAYTPDLLTDTDEGDDDY